MRILYFNRINNIKTSGREQIHRGKRRKSEFRRRNERKKVEQRTADEDTKQRTLASLLRNKVITAKIITLSDEAKEKREVMRIVGERIFVWVS